MVVSNMRYLQKLMLGIEMFWKLTPLELCGQDIGVSAGRLVSSVHRAAVSLVLAGHDVGAHHHRDQCGHDTAQDQHVAVRLHVLTCCP